MVKTAISISSNYHNSEGYHSSEVTAVISMRSSTKDIPLKGGGVKFMTKCDAGEGGGSEM